MRFFINLPSERFETKICAAAVMTTVTKAKKYDKIKALLSSAADLDSVVIVEKIKKICDEPPPNLGICYHCKKPILEGDNTDHNAKGVKHGNGSGCNPYTPESLREEMDRYYGY